MNRKKTKRPTRLGTEVLREREGGLNNNNNNKRQLLGPLGLEVRGTRTLFSYAQQEGICHKGK